MPASSLSVRVSVICVFLNAEAYFREAIDSVLAQDFHDFELVLVNDGSQDASSEMAQDYARRYPHIICLTQPDGTNRGISAARNLGMAAAGGEFIAFIDADDVWHPAKLRQQVEVLDARRDVGMVCGRVNYWGSWQGQGDILIQSGGISDRTLTPPETLLSLYPIGRGAGPTPSDFMFRTALAKDVGGFDEQFTGMYDDQIFLVKVYLIAGIFFSSQCWTRYRQHDQSCTATSRSSGTYLGERRKFFLWLTDYLEDVEFADKAQVLRQVRREIRLLNYPALWKIAWRIGRVLDRISPSRTRLDGIVRRSGDPVSF